MLTPHTFLIYLALAVTILSFIPKLQIPWQVPVLTILIALLLP